MRLQSALSVLLVVLVAGSGAALTLPAHFVATPAPAVALFDAGPLHAEFAAALGSCRGNAACIADTTRALTDKLADTYAALPRGLDGVHGVVDLALAQSGFVADARTDTASPTLEAAILRLYESIDHAVDAALAADVARQTRAMDPVLAASLTRLVDATADATQASRGILSADDLQLISADLRATVLLTTLVGSAMPGSAPTEWQALWDERAAALARVDKGAIAAASARLAEAVRDFEAPARTAASCEAELALPFIVVGGACDDTYAGANLVSVDMGGNDRYLAGAGAGLVGVGAGVSLDLGAGDDLYSAAAMSIGFGLGGVGVLYDEGGSDTYTLRNFGIGSAVAGLGLLYDAGVGDDVYEAQRALDTILTIGGGLAGVGIVVDEGGSDRYHQDGLDGFVYGAGGGHGWLLDFGEGSDSYTSNDLYVELLGTPLGDFTGPVQISAEVGATAILYEEAGDSMYTCGEHVRQGCQGAAGVGALALLLDRAGNDGYTMGVEVAGPLAAGIPAVSMGQGGAYGLTAPPGPAIAVLHDAAGDDTYVAEKWAQGYATAGIGVLLDDAGLDTYTVASALVGARGNGGAWADGPGVGVGRDAA